MFAIEGNRLQRRTVALGPRDERAGTVAVTSGLAAGDRVLARPAPNVVNGQPVVVSAEQATRAPAASNTNAPATSTPDSSSNPEEQ